MEKAVSEEKRRKAAMTDSRKRPSSAIDSIDNKRIKLDTDTSTPTPSGAFLSSFDFTSLPATLITNLIVSNLEAFTEAQLFELVNAYRQSRGIQPSAPTIAAAPAFGTASPASSSIPSGPNAETETDSLAIPNELKEEAVDPLQMDIDEDEMEFEPEKLNKKVCCSLISQRVILISLFIA
jgi:symplekin